MAIIKRLIGIYFNLLSYLAPAMVGKQAFYLFCIPFKAKLKDKHQAFLNTAERKNILVEDKKVTTYKWGYGSKKVLLVHGWQSNTYRWRNYIEELDKSKYTIISFDAPGHGNSEGLFCNVPLYEKTLREVITYFGRPETILSHSIGAFSSLYFLHKNDFNVDKFVSMASPFSAVEFFNVFRSELKLNKRSMKEIEKYFNFYTGHPPTYFSLDKFAPKIKASALLIHDTKDSTTLLENSMKLHEYMSKSELWATDGFGHSLRSKKVVDRVKAFIEN